MGSEVSKFPDDTVQYVDQRQAKELLGAYYDDTEFLKCSKGGLFPLVKIRKAVKAANDKAAAEAAEKARLEALPKTPAYCLPTTTVMGNAGEMIPVTDERVQFVGRGLTGKSIQCTLVRAIIILIYTFSLRGYIFFFRVCAAQLHDPYLCRGAS